MYPGSKNNKPIFSLEPSDIIIDMERREHPIDRRARRAFERAIEKDKRADARAQLKDFLMNNPDFTGAIASFTLFTAAYTRTHEIFWAAIALPASYWIGKMLNDFRDE